MWMATLSMHFVGVEHADAQTFGAYLTQQGISVAVGNDQVTVDVASIEDCDRLGAIVAEYVAIQGIRNPLNIDGPDGPALLRQLGTDEDARMIAGLAASVAYFI